MNCIQFEEEHFFRSKTVYLPNLSKVLLAYSSKNDYSISGVNILVDFNNVEDNRKFIVGVANEYTDSLNFPYD
jgi:hypothetical protein